MLVAAASQKGRRGRATRHGKGTTAGEAGSNAVAAEAREIVRRAVGDAAGLTVKAQVRQAARNLGYLPRDWRVREAWYGRAGAWSAAALDELRARFNAWREVANTGAQRRSVDEIRRGLARLKREVAAIEAEIDSLHPDPGGDL